MTPKEAHKEMPISFVGVDIAVFNDTDPSTKFQLCGEEVGMMRGFHVQSCDRVSLSRRRSSIVMESEETLRNDAILSQLDDEDSDDEFFPSRSSMAAGQRKSIEKDAYTSIPVS